MKADVVIVGAGPAGIFTALELLKRGSRQKIVMVEKGRRIEERRCPKAQTGRCMNCKPYCHITTGFSGAGAFSDGKLSLSYEVGGDLPTLIIRNEDKPGQVAEVTGVLSRRQVNIATMQLYRDMRGGFAVMVMESDQPIQAAAIEELRSLEGIVRVTYLTMTEE